MVKPNQEKNSLRSDEKIASRRPFTDVKGLKELITPTTPQAQEMMWLLEHFGTGLERGIKGIYIGGIPKEKLENLETIASLKIMAVSGEGFIKSNKSFLTKIFKSNASVEILLAGKSTEYVDEVDSCENSPPSVLVRARIAESIKMIADYKKSMNCNTVKVRQFKTLGRCGLIIINEEWAWLTLHLPPLPTEQAISLEIVKPETKQTSSLVKDCCEHFSKLWNTAEETVLP